MGLFYAVNIQDDAAVALSINKKRNTYEVLENAHLDPSNLTNFLTKKRSLYVSIDQNDILNEQISIPTAIKKDNVIRSMILRQFSDIIQNKKIILNYHKLSENTNNDTTLYQVDGVYEDNYVQKLNNIGSFCEIKSISTSIFSLLGLSEQCIEEESYFLVYAQDKNIDILAVHKGVPVFSRVGTIVTDDLESRQMSIVNEITTTITYIKRQFQDIEFSTIVVSGSIAMDYIISENIYTLTQTPIAVLYPNTFIFGLPKEKAQHFIIALGSHFVPKNCQFFPLSIVTNQQYHFLQNMLLLASTLMFLYVSFITYDKYDSYNKSLEQYESIKDRLIETVRKTDTYTQDDLQYSLMYLKIGEKYLRHHPSDLLLALKPLVMMQKPEEINWEYHENKPELSVTFSKPFKSLDALYQFEKRFQEQFNKINTSKTLSLSNQTNYVKMYFNSIVSMEKTKKPLPIRRERRRR